MSKSEKVCMNTGKRDCEIGDMQREINRLRAEQKTRGVNNLKAILEIQEKLKSVIPCGSCRLHTGNNIITSNVSSN